MATALELITDALADIGAIDPIETLTSAETTHGLRKLNELLESWSLEQLLVYQLVQEGFASVSGTASYTIGSGAIWNTTRPLRIESAFIRDSASNDTGLDVVVRELFDAISLKTAQGLPELLYYTPSVATGTITLYPVPNALYTVYLNSLKQLQSFAVLTTEVVLPPGYLRAIKASLALDLAPGYGQTPPAALIAIARDAKAAIKRLNASTPKLSVAHVAFQDGGANLFNINQG